MRTTGSSPAPSGHRLPLGALLLDLDGVLVDSQAVVERTWRRWADAHRLDADHVLARAHGRPSWTTVTEVAPWLDREAEVATLLQWELADTADLRALPGAGRILREVGSLPWAVVTSGHRPLAERRLRTVGLPMPAVMVAADDVVTGKPDPEPYLRAASLLRVEPADAVVVEDSPAGVTAGLAAGMAVVALTTTHDRDAVREATMIVTNLDRLRLEPGGSRRSYLAVADPATPGPNG